MAASVELTKLCDHANESPGETPAQSEAPPLVPGWLLPLAVFPVVATYRLPLMLTTEPAE